MNIDYFVYDEVGFKINSLPSNRPALPLLSQRATTELMDKVKAVFGKDADMAFRIISCESGWRTDVISRTNDIGLFQINLAAHGVKIALTRAEQIAWLQNPDNNIAFAYELFKKSSWAPWVCYTKGLI